MNSTIDRNPEQGVRAELGHIRSIEGLRGVAVLWVIVFHYVILRNGKFDDPWLALVDRVRPLQVIVGNGYLGVDLFFLITGFLLTLPWFHHAAEGRAAPSARDFYVRRVRRIVPAYYVQLAILFALVVPLARGTEFWMRNLWLMLYNIAAHATFLHYTTPISSASLGLNGALWTLALEAQYYALLPLLAPIFVRWPWRTAIVFSLAATAWRWQAAHGLEALVAIESRLGEPWNLPESTIRHLVATQLPGYLAHFAAGVVVGRAWLARHGQGPSQKQSAPWLLAAAAALVGLYTLYAANWQVLGDMTWIFLPLGLGIVMHALVTGAPVAGRLLLANAPIAFVGRVSYSAYLYHLPTLLLWNRYAPPNLGWAALPLYLALVLAISWLSFRLIELPVMRSRALAKERGRLHRRTEAAFGNDRRHQPS